MDSRLDLRRRALIGGGLTAATAGTGYWLTHRGESKDAGPLRTPVRKLIADDARYPRLAVSRQATARESARAAVDALGGMGRFVERGEVVLIKPNASWDRVAEQAANTNPDVVGELARMAHEAGAREVLVADVCINDARRCWERSGILSTVEAAGARIVLSEQRLFREVDLGGNTLRVWPVLEPFLTADKIINVPVAKQHSLCQVTLGMKNWYGILGGARQRLHQRIHESLADLAAFMRPALTVIDCWRVLMRNGPSGGNLDDVMAARTVVAATDAVAADAWAAREYWRLDAAGLPYLKLAEERGLGRLDLDAARMRVVS